MRDALTREEFERKRAAVKAVLSRDSRWLVLVSVGLGIAQLIYIRWADRHLGRQVRLATEGAAFLVYLALVFLLLWRMERHRRAARPTCPRCGVPIEGLSERVAAATGRCDACGGQVIA